MATDLPAEIQETYRKSQRLFLLKRYDDSLQEIRSVFEENKNSKELRMLAAGNYVEQGDYTQAIKHLTLCAQSHPDDPSVMAYLASVYRIAGNLNEAYATAMRGLIRFGDNDSLRVEMAKIAIRMGNLPYARAQIDRVLQMKPGEFDALYLDGLLFLLQKKYEMAEFRFRNALSVSSGKSDLILAHLHNNLGYTLERLAVADAASGRGALSLQRNEEAIRLYERALDTVPSNTIFAANADRLTRAGR